MSLRCWSTDSWVIFWGNGIKSKHCLITAAFSIFSCSSGSNWGQLPQSIDGGGGTEPCAWKTWGSSSIGFEFVKEGSDCRWPAEGGPRGTNGNPRSGWLGDDCEGGKLKPELGSWDGTCPKPWLDGWDGEPKLGIESWFEDDCDGGGGGIYGGPLKEPELDDDDDDEEEEGEEGEEEEEEEGTNPDELELVGLKWGKDPLSWLDEPICLCDDGWFGARYPCGNGKGPRSDPRGGDPKWWNGEPYPGLNCGGPKCWAKAKVKTDIKLSKLTSAMIDTKHWEQMSYKFVRQVFYRVFT